ncbi:MAG: IS3 family transposase [Chitinophagales bacterium]
MNQLYRSIGISKQAAHKYAKLQVSFNQKMYDLVIAADELRMEHPGCGVEKMYYTLKPNFIGRDRFVDTFMQLGYRIKRNKNYRKTTMSSSIYYPNIIQGLSLNRASMIWQTDITYIRVGENFYYAVFIIDVYTREIVGYKVSDHMRAAANIAALHMAFESHEAPLIHHSDRGSQYTCKEYLKVLELNNCSISMGLCAQDNAYAERINRTIKEEYLAYWKPKNFTQLKQQVKKAVNNYNNKRPHYSLGRLNPFEYKQYCESLPKKQKPILTIFENENII